jgi:hypothetical protein
MLLTLLTHLVSDAVQLKLYNNLPYTLYYAIQEPAQNCRTFNAIESYCFIETEFKETHNIQISIVKEIPQAGQDIPLHTINVATPKTLVDLKTYQTAKGEIRLLPRSNQKINLESDIQAINYHDIWLTKTIYKPVAPAQETVQTQSTGSSLIQETTTPTAQDTIPENNAIRQEPPVPEPNIEPSATTTPTA